MRALTLRDGKRDQWLSRVPLKSHAGDRDEKWLQDLLFDNPALIPIEQIEPGANAFIPVCRELTIQNGGKSVYLDVFGCTPQGKLVLIECKLWRNPQARREVIAQILEYAALLRKWSFSDLSIRLAHQLKTTHPNPLFEALSNALPGAEEATFVDSVSASLRSGDFVLIIAGDGIRSDVHAVADHLNQNAVTKSRLALVEIQTWQNEAGELVVVPCVPLRTEVIQQRVLVSADETPLELSLEDQRGEMEQVVDPEAAARRAVVRAYWQKFIDEVEFDHPEQSKPKHQGHNSVRIDLPPKNTWLTAYRTVKGAAGIFLRLRGDEGRSIFEDLGNLQGELEEEVGQPIAFEVGSEDPFEGRVKFDFDGREADHLDWLKQTSNRASASLRVILSQYQ